MRQFALLLALAYLTLGLNQPAEAWGKTGHRVTGAIADHYLSRKARRGIKRILGLEGLAEVSTWADFMRASPDEFWQREASPYHYVTVPEGKRYAEVGAPPQGDAVTALEKLSGMVRDEELSTEERALALRFIVHIIGDLHQPLHAGNGTDRGGNNFRVVFAGELTNLHSVWDTKLIDDEQLSYSEWVEWLQPKITDEQREAWWTADPLVWIGESTAIRDTIYPDDQFLDWSYGFNHMATVKQRLQMGGVRIAAYLNELFD